MAGSPVAVDLLSQVASDKILLHKVLALRDVLDLLWIL